MNQTIQNSIVEDDPTDFNQNYINQTPEQLDLLYFTVQKSQNKNEVISLLNSAISKDPDSPKSAYRYMKLHNHTNNPKYLIKAIQLLPNNAEHSGPKISTLQELEFLGRQLAKEQKFTEAIFLLENFVVLAKETGWDHTVVERKIKKLRSLESRPRPI